jgi:hypothetical protein
VVRLDAWNVAKNSWQIAWSLLVKLVEDSKSTAREGTPTLKVYIAQGEVAPLFTQLCALPQG